MSAEEPNPAEELVNPFTGQTIRFLRGSDEQLVMESTYLPGGAPAPAHLHPSQEEVFTVLSGGVRASVEGEERILREGDVLAVGARRLPVALPGYCLLKQAFTSGGIP